MNALALRTKLTLFYTSTLALLVVAIAAAYYQTLRYQIDASITEELVQLSAGLSGYLKLSPDQISLAYNTSDPEQEFFIETATRLFQIYRVRDGKAMTQSPEMRALGLQLTQSEIQKSMEGPALQDVSTVHGRVRLVNTALPSDTDRTYLMQIGGSLDPLDSALEGFLDALALVLPISLVAAAYLGSLMAGRALSPLKAAARSAAEITPAQLNRRLPVRGADDELDHLLSAFNGTLARLEAAVGQMKQFTASVAHELRTPLTVLRGEAEIALMQNRSDEDYRALVSSQLEEFDKLIRMINETLILARAESGDIRLEQESVDLSALIDELVHDMQPVSSAKEVDLGSNVQPDIRLTGDHGWLERMLLNLIDNAIKFTPEGGKVDVQLTREDNSAVIRVADTGPGIAPEALPHIFDRFFRADPSRSRDVEGAGLGLTLVHWIVEQHHGSIDVDSRPGSGSIFTVRLPLK
jgi:heavy metal sensor kinase